MSSVKGSITEITTDRDGNTTVIVDKHEIFRHPGALTDGQLAELKRAQDHNKQVTVKWTDKGEKRIVDSVTVH